MKETPSFRGTISAFHTKHTLTIRLLRQVQHVHLMTAFIGEFHPGWDSPYSAS